MGTPDRDASAEAAARAALAAMTPRLGDPPHALLGVPPGAPPEALRSAFLTLTKRFHPTKYARFAPDVVRAANEVFLTIKRAYDQLNASPRAVTPQGSGGVRAAGTGSLPARAPTVPPATARPPTGPRAATPPTGVPIRPPTGPRAATPPTGVPIRPPTGPRAATPPTGVPIRPSAAPRARVATPVHGVPVRPQTAPPRAPAGSTAPPRAATIPGRPAPAPTAPPPATDPAEAAHELLRRRLWSDARQAFHRLAVAAPQDRGYRAYMHYARGREAAEAGRADEARAELQRALALDPDLYPARSALDDLPPEPPQGGLLSRLLKR